MKMRTVFYVVGSLAVLWGCLLLARVGFLTLIMKMNRSVQKVSFPRERSLSEQDAIAISKEALFLDGKHSPGMHPVPNGHKDSSGKDVIFAVNTIDPNSGCVLWWISRAETKWEYMVRLTRAGDQVICEIIKPL